MRISAVISIILFMGFAALGQMPQKCSIRGPVFEAPSAPNIFTPQQEVDLGDIEAERIERTSHVIHDDKLSAYMDRIVQRILAQMPPTHLQFRVTLIDVPAVNAFSLPGGRIYVTRKMVAFTRTEDELADLLGHEMGHILSHQGAIEMTREFHEVLGVDSIGDPKDIADKFNRLLDNIARNPRARQRANREEESHQYQADEVGLYALGNAGYSPATFADFFDRLARTQGKTGGWLSDLLGLTTPNEKRLREIRKSIDALPLSCRPAPASEPSQEFLTWQASVIAYSGLGRNESLSGILDKKTLDPPLRNDVTNLKFSPDGKYLLAQDDSSIFVLSRDPFRLLFRVDAPDSHAAQFTPDSEAVVFDTRGMRVEQWSVAEGERVTASELAFPGGCSQTLLAPDGKVLACVDNQFGISLYDVAQGTVLFNKKHCFEPNADDAFTFWWQLLASMQAGVDFQWVHMAFSPDSKVFVGANWSGTIAVDLATRAPLALHGGLPGMIRGGFVFLSPDRVIAVNRSDPKSSAIFRFPSGELIDRLPLGGERLSAAAHGNYVIVGPLREFPTGVLDLSSHKFVFGSKDNYAVDVYDQTLALQARDGEIGLYRLGSAKLEPIAHIDPSLSPLGRLHAEAVSPDLKWVALSGDSRGAVWNVSTSKRLYYTRSFHGAYFDGDTALLADYPKLAPQGRSIARLDLAGGGARTLAPVDEQSAVRQWGPFLVTRKPARKGGTLFRDTILEINEIRSGDLLWSRTFPKELPSMTLLASADTLLIGWQVDADAAKDELRSHPALQAQLRTIHDRKDAWRSKISMLAVGGK